MLHLEPGRQAVIVIGSDATAIADAAQALADGALVAFPTETVYGLGARADSDAAVARIFAAKGRPSEHPLIVHVADAEGAAAFAAELSPLARRLMDSFWPGPLTVIVRRREGLAAAAAGGQDSIGLRCPSHPVAQALLRACAALGVPGLAAPSANRFGRVSPTTAAHVQAEFGEEEKLLVLDGGACEIGIESSIVDCSREHAVLLRPGVIERARIEAVLGQPLHEADDNSPRASGTLEAHYAPRAKVRLMSAAMLRDALALLGPAVDPGRKGEHPPGGAAAARSAAAGLAVYSRTLRPAGARVVFRRMPDSARATAHELFAVLRELDTSGVALIWVEQPPDTPDWDGVRDRLQRATAA